MAERTHWVEVNETWVMLTHTAAEWWAQFRFAHHRTGRIKIVKPGVIGDTVHVACSHREHAEWLADFLRRRGLPKTAVKLRQYRAGEEPPPKGLTDDELAAYEDMLDRPP